MTEKIAQNLVDWLGVKEPQTKQAAIVLIEYLLLFDQKQHDYGPGNIARFGEQGILVRSSDKLERLINLADRGEDPSVSGEAVDDTWQDLMGYALIAQLVRRGMWLGSRPEVRVPTIQLDPVAEFFKDDPMLGAAARDLLSPTKDRDVLSPDGDHHEDDDCPRDHDGMGSEVRVPTIQVDPSTHKLTAGHRKCHFSDDRCGSTHNGVWICTDVIHDVLSHNG